MFLRCRVCGKEYETAVWTIFSVCPACETGKRYRYYLLLRPPMIGTHPDGDVAREVWSPSHRIPDQAPDFDWRAHGWVEYVAPLAPERIWHFDMRPADREELAAYMAWREENGR